MGHAHLRIKVPQVPKFINNFFVVGAAAQILIVACLCVFIDWDDDHNTAATDYNEGTYGLLQDVNIMIFVGFAFLFNMLPRYGWSAVSIVICIGAMAFEWFIVCSLWINEDNINDGHVNLNVLIGAIFAACSMLIAVAGVLGRVSMQQLVILMLCGVPTYCWNMHVVYEMIGAHDTGGTIVIHAFGAFFGAAISFFIGHNDTAVMTRRYSEDGNYETNLLAMIGTLFLWCYYPSFNGYGGSWSDGFTASAGDANIQSSLPADLNSGPRFRATFNTQLALIAAAVTSIIASDVSKSMKKNKMIHMQTGILAGGVTLGCLCDMNIKPWGAVLLGTVGALVCLAGIYWLTPFMEKTLNLHDTCDCMALHGIPAFVSVFASIIAIYMDSCITGYSAGDDINSPSNDCRDKTTLMWAQAKGIFSCVGIALGSGAVTGGIMSFFSTNDHWYDSGAHFDKET